MDLHHPGGLGRHMGTAGMVPPARSLRHSHHRRPLPDRHRNRHDGGRTARAGRRRVPVRVRQPEGAVLAEARAGDPGRHPLGRAGLLRPHLDRAKPGRANRQEHLAGAGRGDRVGLRGDVRGYCTIQDQAVPGGSSRSLGPHRRGGVNSNAVRRLRARPGLGPQCLAGLRPQQRRIAGRGRNRRGDPHHPAGGLHLPRTP